MSQIGKNNSCYRHGMTGTPEYRTWTHIKDRCLNPNSEEAISKPKRESIKYYYRGQYLIIANIARIENIPASLIYEHIDKNDHIDDAIYNVLFYLRTR